MSADPAGFALINPNRGGYSVIEATNWYSYVSNNPVKYVDPNGMFEESSSEIQELAEKYDSMKVVNINEDQSNPDDRHDVYIYCNENDKKDTLHVNRKTLQEGALKDRTKMKSSEIPDNAYTAKSALADIADLAESINMSSDDMINSLSLVLAAVSGSKAEENDTYSVGFAFLDSGFRSEYQDGSSQVRHFAGYLLRGYYWGTITKMSGRYRGDDSVDQALGDAGIQAGLSEAYGGQSTDFSLGDWIRSNL